MPLEEDAQAFLQRLEHSLGEDDEPFEPILAALSMMLRQVADAAEHLERHPGRLFDAARDAYGFEAADVLASLAGIVRTSNQDAFIRPNEDVLYQALGEVSTAYGGDVSAWGLAMGFLLRNLWEAAHGSEEPRYTELLLHHALGIEAAFSWHRICRAARPRG